MAHSKPNEPQRPLAGELAEELCAAPKRLEIASDDGALPDRHITIPEALDLGHARLRNECWSALRKRSRRRARRRTLLHLVRPSEAADARFISAYSEFIE